MRLRVLVVEDNPLNSELVSDILTMEGHEVDLAASGAALRALVVTGATPDILLMDILLPDADGVALLGELRAIERFATVPVIALTAHALTGDEGRLLAAGFNAVITKPIDTRTFVREVTRLAMGTNRTSGAR